MGLSSSWENRLTLQELVLWQYHEGSIGTSTAVLEGNLTVKQSQASGLLMLKRDCPVTQLLAPSVSLELAFTCPCPGPGRAKQGIKNNSAYTESNFFGSLLSDWRFPKCFVFTADDFWVWNMRECLWDHAVLPSFQLIAKATQQQACFVAYSLEILY